MLRFLKVNKTIALLIALFLLGFGLRLIAVNQSLWLDEAISVETALNFSLKEIIIRFSPKDFNPPVYYLFLHLWLKIFPSSEFWIRLPSIIFGLISGFFVYKIYFLIFKEKKGAFLSLLLLLTSPLHIYYSQEARMYSLATLAVCGSMFYFLKSIKEKRFNIWWPVFSILMVYSHYLCWFAVVVQVLFFLILKSYKKKAVFINFLVGQIIILGSFLFWLPIFLSQLKMGEEAEKNLVWSRLNSLNLKNLALLPVKFIIGRTGFTNKIFYFFIVLGLALFYGFIFVSVFKREFFEKNKKGIDKLKIFPWLWLFFPPFLGAVISVKIPIFSYFRFLFCLPAFYLIIGQVKENKKLSLLVVIINFFFSLRYLFVSYFHREDWRTAVAVLHQKNKTNAPVLLLKNVIAPFNYYDRGRSRLIFIEEKELIGNEIEFWLIPYALPIFDSQGETKNFLNKEGFLRVYEQHFRGVSLEKWQKPVAFRL